MSREREYLQDILKRIQMIEQFTADGRDAFEENLMAQEAVIRCYEVIGEIVKRISPSILNQYDEIPWKQIIGFRDFLIHNYEKVKLDIVWEAVQTELSPLHTTVETMLANLPPE